MCYTTTPIGGLYVNSLSLKGTSFRFLRIGNIFRNFLASHLRLAENCRPPGCKKLQTTACSYKELQKVLPHTPGTLASGVLRFPARTVDELEHFSVDAALEYRRYGLLMCQILSGTVGFKYVIVAAWHPNCGEIICLKIPIRRFFFRHYCIILPTLDH